MTEAVVSGKRLARVLAALVLLGACTSEDVGGSDKSGTGATSGVGSQAAGGAPGGAAGVDTAGGRLNTDRSGSVVAPGPGQIPGTPGGDTAGATKTKGARP